MAGDEDSQNEARPPGSSPTHKMSFIDHLKTTTVVSTALTPEVIAETKLLIKLSGPIGLSMAGVFALQFVELAFLGHFKTEFLAAASVALIWMNVTSCFLFQGFANAMSALVSQANGAGNKKLAGAWFQQAAFYGTIACVPIAILWWHTEKVLLACSFGRTESHLAGEFVRWRVIGLWPTAMMNLLIAFYQAQEIIYPGMVVNLTGVALDAVLHLVLLRGVRRWGGLGFAGSPIASSLTSWTCLIVFSGYTFLWKRMHEPTWPGWNFNFLTKRLSREFLWEQAFPASLATTLEELQLEAISFMAAEMGEAEVSAHNSLLTLLMLLNAFSFGAMNATTIRVGHYLGANDVRMAKNVAWITVTVLGLEGFIVGIVLISGRSAIPYIFSNDPFVVTQERQLMILLAIAYMLVSLFFTAIAVLQGQGRPIVIAVCFIVGAWMLGVPMSYVLGNVIGLRLRGLWFGIVIGYVVTTVLAGSVIVRTDWAKVAQTILTRADAQPEQQHASLVSPQEIQTESILDLKAAGTLANRAPAPPSDLHEDHDSISLL